MAVRAERSPAALSPLRTVALAIGFLCAVAASVTLFVTDSAESLRIGILVALWGFVFAALAAGRRQTEQAVAASAEIELRKSYELELEREVAARREYELRLETLLRRELQDEFASQVGALREEMAGLRRELSEQWDSELRVERMVMRTQSVRMAGEPRGSLGHDRVARTSIDSGPVAIEPYADLYGGDPYGADSTVAGSYGADSDGGPSYQRGPAAPVAREADPATSEFPAVVDRTPPVPPLPPPRSTSPDPPSSGFPTLIPVSPPEPVNGASDDVLARVLAEAGLGNGGRRRKHRYADEDQDAGAP